MALAALAVNARRAATLLRCQTVREARRRRDTRRADQDDAAAAAAEREAREAADRGRAAGAERLRRAYDALSGRTVDLSDLAALPGLARTLAEEDRTSEATVETAVAAARAARAAASAARAALLTESRATQRRSKLAERARTLWHRAADAAEEQERDDQVADTWRPA